MKRIVLRSIFLFFVVMSCENKQENDAEIASINTETEIEKMVEEMIANGEKIPIGEFNDLIQKAMSARQSWAYSPVMIAQQFTGNNMETGIKTVHAKSRSGNELITSAWVIITEEGLQDDSIKDRRFLIQVDLGGSIWQVSKAYKAHRCRKGRGESVHFHAQRCE